MASAASAADRALLAESNNSRLWLAEIAPPAAGESHRTTIIYTRQMQEAKWQRVGAIPAPALSIHELRGELAVLLADGSWRLVRPAGPSQEADQRMGQRPPGPIRAMATNGQKLWAICIIPGGLAAATTPPSTRPGAPRTRPARPVPELRPAPPATQASTQASTQAATQASTQPAAPPGPVPSPVLYELDRGIWRPIADVPVEIIPGGPAVCATLAIINDVPTIAVSPLGQDLQIHRLSAAGVWQHETLPKLPAEVQFLQVVWCSGKPTLCAIGPAQWMVCKDLNPKDLNPAAAVPHGSAVPTTAALTGNSTQPAEPAFTSLATMSPMPSPAEVTVFGTSASDLRIVYRPEKSKPLMERLYGTGGQPTSSAQPVALPAGPPPTSQIRNIPMMLVVAMMLIFLSSLRRRPTDQQVQYILRRVRPAPLLRRAAAGLIDLSPAVAGALVTMWQISRAGQSAGQSPPDFLELMFTPIAAGGILVYLLHTTLAEVFLGRSVGKMLLGLQVVTTDGQLPGRTALLTRNLLRVVDVVIFPPLALMAAFSPVHQRLADVVAGTLVIIPGQPEKMEEEPVASEEAEEDREE